MKVIMKMIINQFMKMKKNKQKRNKGEEEVKK